VKVTAKRARQIKRGDTVLSFAFLQSDVEKRNLLGSIQAFIDGGAQVRPIGRVRVAHVMTDDDVVSVEFWPGEGDERDKLPPSNYSLIGHFLVIDKAKAK